MRTIALLLLLAAVTAAASPGPRDLTDAEYAETLRLFMTDGRAAADAYLGALADSCGGQPLYLLAKARVVLEAIPIDDDGKEFTAEVSAPAFALLDEVIAWADAELDRNGDELRPRYYRGWAWMMKSQFKAFGRDFYGAGRDAGKGKNDIEAYLEAYPDEPIPNGLLGAYLYFTDAVPKLFQFLSKLLFLPTGDRARGLEMIAFAVAGDSPARVDYEVLDANVTFFFEGRLEEGLGLANGLLERYPRYPRLALASAVAAPLDPFRATSHLERTGAVLADLDGAPEIDRASFETLRCYHALGLRVIAGHAAARAVLEPLAAAPPPHPDWAGPFARLELAQMAAAEGRTDEARELALRVRDDDTNDRFRDQAKLLLKDLEKRPTAPDPVTDDLVARLYGDDPGDLAETFATLAGGSARAAFYAAEARLLAGDRRGALRGFRDLHAREVAEWDGIWWMLASARIGEISAAAGNWRSAAGWMGRAAGENQDIDKLDWLLQGRQRYFEELGEDAARWPAPTLLPAAP
jgi:hypothetical protein